MNTVVLHFAKISNLIPHARQLQLAIEFWRAQYAEASEMTDRAWHSYYDAADENLCDGEIADRYARVRIFEDLCTDAWGKLQLAKAELLALSN